MADGRSADIVSEEGLTDDELQLLGNLQHSFGRNVVEYGEENYFVNVQKQECFLVFCAVNARNADFVTFTYSLDKKSFSDWCGKIDVSWVKVFLNGYKWV